MTQRVALSDIRTDGGTQMRDAINVDTVREYAECIDQLPPIVTFFDGIDHWIGDGFHRYHAHHKADHATIEVDARSGTKRDAILYAVAANASHGLRRTNADKRKAVRALLDDDEWAQWSDREIARRCGVGNKFVSDLRNTMCVPNTDRKCVRSGTTYTQKPKSSSTKLDEVDDDDNIEDDELDDDDETEEVEQVEASSDHQRSEPEWALQYAKRLLDSYGKHRVELLIDALDGLLENMD